MKWRGHIITMREERAAFRFFYEIIIKKEANSQKGAGGRLTSLYQTLVFERVWKVEATNWTEKKKIRFLASLGSRSWCDFY